MAERAEARKKIPKRGKHHRSRAKRKVLPQKKVMTAPTETMPENPEKELIQRLTAVKRTQKTPEKIDLRR